MPRPKINKEDKKIRLGITISPYLAKLLNKTTNNQSKFIEELLKEYFTENDYLAKDLNWFWHEEDTLTLTSFGYVWVYPGKQPIKNSIAVMPELKNDDVSKCMGICSDIIEKYKK